ncbi:MAG: ATP-binding protein [Desulfomonilaceae bacterium]
MNDALIRIPKRITTALINSLASGVVPRIGLEYIAVGRRAETAVLLEDLENVSEGAAFSKFIIGRYGSGKSFLLQLLRNYAMDRNFVVADVDLSPERRLIGSSGQGRATYRELMHNLSTKTRPDGGALEAILERWISLIQTEVRKESGVDPQTEEFSSLVEARIFDVVHRMEAMIHGFDFARVVTAYWRGYREDKDELKGNALRWLLGEFSTKTEARSSLGVAVIVDDANWYDYIKLLASFVTTLGYKGLLVLIDEAVNLYKISHSVSRQTNYEKMLSIYNDTMQGKAQRLGIMVGGTPQFLEDQRRGLYSYEALRSRLADSRFTSDGWRNYSGPIIRLETLTNEEIFVLLSRLAEVHSTHHNCENLIQPLEIQNFMQETVNRLGAEALLTPREVVRDFISLLDILRDNPGITMADVLKGPTFHPRSGGKDPDKDDAGDFEEFVL